MLENLEEMDKFLNAYDFYIWIGIQRIEAI